MRCPDCGQDQPDSNRFCEDCGTRLVAVPPGGCGQCGAAAGSIDANGYCDRCGFQQPPAGVHVEEAASTELAGVTDRGRRYERNEDAFALAADPMGDVLVVCDGVSCSQTPDAASRTAAAVVRDSLLAAVRAGMSDDVAAVGEALTAAHAAVAELPADPAAADPLPETTAVAAVRRGRRVVAGWLGDSRAYHVTPDAARQLTTDHSWLQEEVAAGRLTRDEAMRSRQAHAITRTVGGPSGPDEPEVRAFDLPAGPGLLLLCTDGLWAAFPDPAELARAAWRLAHNSEALAVARGLVEAANARDGRDNATAAVLVLDRGPAAGGIVASDRQTPEGRP